MRVHSARRSGHLVVDHALGRQVEVVDVVRQTLAGVDDLRIRAGRSVVAQTECAQPDRTRVCEKYLSAALRKAPPTVTPARGTHATGHGRTGQPAVRLAGFGAYSRRQRSGGTRAATAGCRRTRPCCRYARPSCAARVADSASRQAQSHSSVHTHHTDSSVRSSRVPVRAPAVIPSRHPQELDRTWSAPPGVSAGCSRAARRRTHLDQQVDELG